MAGFEFGRRKRRESGPVRPGNRAKFLQTGGAHEVEIHRYNRHQ